MQTLKNKRVLLGITGSIAAYKSVELVRRLREQGAQVRVVMTKAATKFITPLTLQTVSKQPVHISLFDTEAAIEHIELSRWAEAILIAPITANFLAKLAYGHADDLLSTICLATTAPIAVAPAMNQQMWQASITQENCKRLQQHGIKIFGPAIGTQACGETGAGRMLEPLELLQNLQELLQIGILQGKQVLITAGPTSEDIDPVRFIGNRSSGRMGYAVANAALLAGAQVTLISGPVALSPPIGMAIISIYSAQDMLTAVMEHIDNKDIFIATAAVADYRPIQRATQKLKKTEAQLQINLERTVDILTTVTCLVHPPFTVGFAAETSDKWLDYARSKLKLKKLDMIVANQVGVEGIGFDSKDNAVRVIWNDGDVDLPRCSKNELAKQLLAIITQRYQLLKRT